MTSHPGSTRHPLVSCVVLNWNRWRDTVECLKALTDCSYPQLTVLVVDNGSTDNSVAKIQEAFPDILLLKSETNLGFAGGNNIGIRHALAQGADYVWLLNNDTMPAPDALSALVAKAQSDHKVGAVASICYYADDPTKVQAWAGAQINLWIGYGRNAVEPKKDEWFDSLYGASMLVAGPAFIDVGILDPGFFFYWEETELCIRLRNAGWRLAAAPDSRVLHKVSASAGTNMSTRDRYSTASALRILHLHSAAPRLAIVLFLILRLGRRVLHLELSRCISVWAGVQDYLNTRQEPQAADAKHVQDT